MKGTLTHTRGERDVRARSADSRSGARASLTLSRALSTSSRSSALALWRRRADDLDDAAAASPFVSGDARIALLPTACQASLKRLACARAHLACDGGDGCAVARPCRALCDDVARSDGPYTRRIWQLFVVLKRRYS